MTWEELTGKWAVPGYDKKVFSSLDEAIKASTVDDPKTYGHKIINIAEILASEEVTQEEVDKFYGKDTPEENPDNKGDTEETEKTEETPDKPSDTSSNLIAYILKMIWKFIKLLLGK